MSDSSSQPGKNRFQKLLGRFVYSDLAGTLSKVPPISWIIRGSAYQLAKSQIGKNQSVANNRLHGEGLQGALEGIVNDVVEILGFAGAMVATYDEGDALTVKAAHFDPQLITLEQIQVWEKQASALIGRSISLTNPDVARVYIHRKEDQKNLGVQAALSGENIMSDRLFDLFTPIAPDSLKDFIQGAQDALKIQQVITVPFFIETDHNNTTQTKTKDSKDFVGNLFAAKCGLITEKDIQVLSTFAQYVASFILSERRRIQVEVIEKLILDIQKNLKGEEQVLERIVEGVVKDLGYEGAMVATYEPGDLLPVRALYVDPQTATLEEIHKWEADISKLLAKPLSLTDPEIARVFPHQAEYKHNLSAKAAEAGKPVISTELFDLFTPIVPDSAQDAIRGIQDAIGIRQVIAVPFFLETIDDAQTTKELVGNLFAASRSYKISAWEIEILQAFGQQAAAGLRNVRLYRKSEELLRETEILYQKTEDLYRKGEERRQAAEIFGKMAFTASASVHALRNHMGVIKGNLQLVKLLDQMDEGTRQSVLQNQIPRTLERLDEMRQLIESLHEPWRPINDTTVNINACLKRAIDKVVPEDNQVWIKLALSSEPMEIKTTPEMLTEAFKVLVKNAKEALQNQPEAQKALWIESRLQGDQIEVVIRDNGMGISPENLEKVFEMRFTTKSSGLGFGLFWARDYIHGLGGQIEVASTEGEGTTFIVTLPAAFQIADLPGQGARQ